MLSEHLTLRFFVLCFIFSLFAHEERVDAVRREDDWLADPEHSDQEGFV